MLKRVSAGSGGRSVGSRPAAGAVSADGGAMQTARRTGVVDELPDAQLLQRRRGGREQRWRYERACVRAERLEPSERARAGRAQPARELGEHLGLEQPAQVQIRERKRARQRRHRGRGRAHVRAHNERERRHARERAEQRRDLPRVRKVRVADDEALCRLEAT
jgi:hypothetical protein